MGQSAVDRTPTTTLAAYARLRSRAPMHRRCCCFPPHRKRSSIRDRARLCASGDTQNITPVDKVYWTWVQLPKNVIFDVCRFPLVFTFSHLLNYAEATDQAPGVSRSVASAECATLSSVFCRSSTWGWFPFAYWKAGVDLQRCRQRARFHTCRFIVAFCTYVVGRTAVVLSFWYQQQQ